MKTKAQLEIELETALDKITVLETKILSISQQLHWHKQANQTFLEILHNASKEANFPPRRPI